jgi:triosephosphate isomerase
MRKKIIAGNWKMNKTAPEASELAKGIRQKIDKSTEVDVVMCPPFIDLAAVYSVIHDSYIDLGGQNLHWEEKGAFTGEISADMLKSVGCHYVIIGHSERRQYFGETDETVNKKIKSALHEGLIPIVCVGELLEEREADKTKSVIETQVKAAFEDIDKIQAQKTVLAYEPVWAIGTGKVATPEQAQEVHEFIRKLLTDIFDEETAETIRIQYGGSMKPDNAAELLSQPDVDGGLIGGASLDVDSFVAIINHAKS